MEGSPRLQQVVVLVAERAAQRHHRLRRPPVHVRHLLLRVGARHRQRHLEGGAGSDAGSGSGSLSSSASRESG